MKKIKWQQKMLCHKEELIRDYKNLGQIKFVSAKHNIPHYILQWYFKIWKISVKRQAWNNIAKWRKENPNYQTGSRNPAWKDGFSKSSVNRLVKRVLGDANISLYLCQKCGHKGTQTLNIHHRDENRKNNKVSNLVVLCARCHSITHKELHESRRNKKTGRYT